MSLTVVFNAHLSANQKQVFTPDHDSTNHMIEMIVYLYVFCRHTGWDIHLFIIDPIIKNRVLGLKISMTLVNKMRSLQNINKSHTVVQTFFPPPNV